MTSINAELYHREQEPEFYRNRFKLRPAPRDVSDTMVNEVYWPLLEQIAREQQEQENDDA